MGHTEVERVLGWDEARGVAFFLGSPPRAPSQRHLYSVSASASAGPAECLTCKVGRDQVGGRRCLFADVKLNPR